MAAATAGHAPGPQSSFSSPRFLARLALIALVNAFAVLLGSALVSDGNAFLGLTIIVTAILLSVVNAMPRFWPLRWMTPALALVALLVIYPMLYTLYIAFTNYSDGHRFTRDEAVTMLSRETYLPEGEASFSWEVFRSAEGTYALWLTDETGSSFFATQNAPLESVPGGEVPDTYAGYTHLTGGERFQALREIQTLRFGPEDSPVGIASRNQAGRFQPVWDYDAEAGVLTNVQTGVVYRADNTIGEFVAPDGSTAPLGYWVPVGLQNSSRIFTSPVIRGPLASVFLWTITFAVVTVISSFSIGLLVALALNKSFPGIRAVRSLMIIPYAIPGVISVLIWRGMLNPNLGIIGRISEQLFGFTPPFFSDADWARFAVLLVNLWLTYPYFMLVCSGALQSIPASIYEAAEIDGANAWQRFRKLTLPLLLVATGPLLVASFTFNFNNFMLIEGLFQGGPPMPGTSAPPVGFTDNLITYTYRFAFSSGGTRDYGFASAIAIVIFIVVGLITLFQFRFTKRLEEIGENV